MPYKLNPDGQIATQDVNGQKQPIFVHADGREAPFDAETTLSTISRLNGEAKGHREAKEAAEAALKPFKDAGLTDAAAAAKALATVKNLDDKKLVDAGQVEEIKQQAIKAVHEQYAPVKKKADDLEAQLYNERIGGAFARSKVIADKFAIPADLVQARFGQNFKVEDGRIVAYDKEGNKLFSRVNPGNAADFEEALEMIVETYPHKAHILKGSGGSGGGAQGGNNGTSKKTYTRAQFDALDPAQKAATAAAVGKGEAVLTD